MHHRTTRGATIGALLLAAAACDAGAPIVTPGDDPPDAARTTIGPLVATLQLPMSEVMPGGTFVVRYQLSNLSSDSVRLELACTSDVTFRLLAPDGSAVTPGGCLTAITTRTLAPGGFILHDFPMRAERPGLVPTPLPAGRYVLVAEPNVLRIDGVDVTATPLSLTRSLQVR
jgi:hypothetical protein